jgi:Lon-like ATP-dependent protease
LHSPRWVTGKQLLHPDTSSATTNPKKEEEVLLDGPEDENAPGSSSESAPPASSSGNDDPSDNSDPPDSPPPSSPSPTTQSSIAKQSVPEIYPTSPCTPYCTSSLFPGFYKAVVVRNPAVVAAIKEMMKRGQPYLGAFLLKDENTDSDVITDINSVHPVGVFAQITSVFAANSGAMKEGESEKEEGLTAVLYPHRRIKITELVKAGGGSTAAVESVEQEEQDIQTVTPPSSPKPIEPGLSPEQLAKLHPRLAFSYLFSPPFI